MVESGFVFPESCKSILKPMEVIIETSFENTYNVFLPRLLHHWTTSSFAAMLTRR